MKLLKAILLSFCGVMLSFGVNAAEESEKTKPYPLEVCIVSDEKLGSMGKPHVFVHEGQEIKLCCKSCMKGFKKDPAGHLKKLKTAKK